MGWFEYKICPMTEFDHTEPHWCFDSDDSLIEFTDGTTRWDIPGTNEGHRPGESGWWYTM